VDELSWTFVRGDDDEERLTIARDPSAGPPSMRLIVTTNGAARSFEFPDLTAAERFQSDMEAFLVKSGWAFIEFSPEHRTGDDRRHFPRLRERRRWWTDGMVTVKQFLDWDSHESKGPASPLSTEPKRDRERDPT
jgi:hypothetical protein